MERFKLVFVKQDNGSWFCRVINEVGEGILDSDGNDIECCLKTIEDCVACILEQFKQEDIKL